MSNVVKFEIPEKPDPHGSGEAFCTGCKHTWVAVAPVGTTQLECPECGSMKGHWKYEFAPETMWQCNCGNDLFYLTPKGTMCPNCGTVQVF